MANPTPGVGLTQLWPRSPCVQLQPFSENNQSDIPNVLLAGTGGCPWSAIWTALNAGKGVIGEGVGNSIRNRAENGTGSNSENSIGISSGSSAKNNTENAQKSPVWHIHLWEPQAPLLARHLLFLFLLELVDKQDTTKEDINNNISLDDWALVMADLFGNAQCRPQSWHVLQDRVLPALIRAVTGNEDEVFDPASMQLRLDELKFRERDDLEFTFKFWRDSLNGGSRQQVQKSAFDIEQLWDARLRQFHGVRYDSRHNLVDWDYQMKLKEFAPIIHSKEYAHWRETGIAFQIRESQHSIPNRTLATVAPLKDRKEGVSVLKWGYFSDILVSPYVGLGVEPLEVGCERLMRQHNGQYTYSAHDVFLYNLRGILQRWTTGLPYYPPDYDPKAEKEANEENSNEKTLEQPAKDANQENDEVTELAQETSELSVSTNKESQEVAASVDAIIKSETANSEKQNKESDSSLDADANAGNGRSDFVRPRFIITLLPCDFDQTLKKRKHQHKFDSIYLGNGIAHRLKDVGSMLSANGQVIAETAKFMLDLNKEQVDLFGQKMMEFAKEGGLEVVRGGIGRREAHFVYKHAKATKREE